MAELAAAFVARAGWGGRTGLSLKRSKLGACRLGEALLLNVAIGFAFSHVGGERSRSGNVGGEFVYGKISLDKNSCAATWM